MPSTRDVRARLQRALDKQQLVRIERSLPFAYRDDVYVLAIGEKWFLTIRVVDGGYFDGYEAMRLRDLKRVWRQRHFDEQTSTQLNPWPPSQPERKIELDSTRGLVLSVGASDVVFGIEKERQRSAMWIGTLDEVAGGMVWLNELDMKARWSKDPRGYKVAKITAVTWGGRYMAALERSAGAKPAPSPRLGESAE